jgi:hypothetical protein
MSAENASSAVNLPPHVRVIEMATAAVVSRVVWVAAKLGVADMLAGGARSADELAGPAGLHAPSLHRLLRTLGMLGIVHEEDGHRFALTPLGEAMREGAPGCAKSTILTFGGPAMSAALGEFEHSVRTGQTGFEKALGVPIFGYFAQHPDEAKLFSETMIGFHGAEPPAVAAAYDFGSVGTLVDVGGSSGNMLAAVLARHPGVRGVLFDLPHVVSQSASSFLASNGLDGRVSVVPGDFFSGVPAGGDCYLLSHIIHDWNEEQCLTILRNVRAAMKPEARLLIVEMVLPTGDAPHPGKILDMVMLVVPGGRERTEAEYRDLLAKAGFRLTRVVPTASPVSVVEALPA